MTPIEEELTDVLSDFYNELKRMDYKYTGLSTEPRDEFIQALTALYYSCRAYYDDE